MKSISIDTVKQCETHNKTASRAPTDDCDDCWAFYNYQRDLPVGNRTAVSNFKEDGLRWSRFVPDLTFNQSKHDRITGSFLEEITPIAIGIDAGIANNGFVVVGLFGGEIIVDTEVKSISFGQDVAYKTRTRRLAILVNRANQLWKKSGGEASVFIEDHSYNSFGNLSNEKSELHGAIRINMYSLGADFSPIPIKTRLKSVHRNAKSSIGKKDIKNIWKEKYSYASNLTEHELDALLIALTPIREVLFSCKQQEHVSLKQLREGLL